MNQRGSILVVDDDRLVLATLVHELSQAGFKVLQADNGDDAILLARQHHPQLALLDIRMQGLSGFDVAQYLRDYSRVPFIFLSAHSDPATRAKAAELGALECLGKPLRTAELIGILDDQLLALGAAPSLSGSPGSLGSRSAPEGSIASEPHHPFDFNVSAESEVHLAVGILMHRYSLDRRAALGRLKDLAQSQGRSLERAAHHLLAAQEQLAQAGVIQGF